MAILGKVPGSGIYGGVSGFTYIDDPVVDPEPDPEIEHPTNNTISGVWNNYRTTFIEVKPPTPSIQHLSKGISRLATQYRESINLINYIKVLLSEADTIETVLKDILNKRWLETATGIQLDVLGAIVGQTREFVDAEIFKYFGFDDHPQAQSFGSVYNVGVGGRFITVGEPITGYRLLSDDEYRLYIRARIIRNSTTSTPEEIIAHIRYIFNSPLVILADGNMYYTISIGRKLNLNEKSILVETDIIPNTAGVGFSYVTEFYSDNFFGFIGVPGSRGFGSVNNVNLGGEFGQLIF